jgi:hypothetical protein
MIPSNTAASLPSPKPDESSDVSVALEAAKVLWDKGDRNEALRWCSRAAQAAELAGDDRRALELARVVAELKDSSDNGRSESTASAKPITRPPPLPGATSATSTRPASTTTPPPPPSIRTREEGGTASKPPPAPSTRARTSPSVSPAAQGRADSPDPEPRAPDIPRAAKAPGKLPAAEAGARVHVSVKASVRDPSLLLVRVLSNGQKAPPGTHEAFLTAIEEGVDLLKGR